jgi:aryl-alcohol dehydrogenase-like predicted oxidoreductase
MRYRTLGHSGLKLSTIGLGSWLTFGTAVDKATARACVLRAWELGVNFIDTANVYGRGAAEVTLAPILKELNRDELVLATKVFFPMGEGINERGLSRKHMRHQMDRSLGRLDVEYVDLYQCHRFDPTTPLEETCEAMDDLVRAGKALYWGISEWNADQIAAAATLCRARGWTAPISNQPQYSALWRRIEARVLPTCQEYGIGNVVFSPLAMGILTGKYTDVKHPPRGTRAAGAAADMMEDYFTAPVLDAVAKAKAIATRAGCSLSQLALAWCLRQPAVTSAIVGVTSVSHVDDNVAAADLTPDPAILAEFDSILAPVAPHEDFIA